MSEREPDAPTPGVPASSWHATARATARSTASDDARLGAALARHFALVWRSLRRFGVLEADVDDAVQHVFLTLSARLAEVPLEKERSFLLGACLRVAANARRRDLRRPDHASDELEQRADEAPGPEELLASKQRRAELDRALDDLPLDQRTVFVLFELEGFSLPEIAESLAIPLGTATSRLRRARDRFEAWVERRGTRT
jgi:RNA polymerase sigma-70 factor (ECF subfamily)